MNGRRSHIPRRSGSTQSRIISPILLLGGGIIGVLFVFGLFCKDNGFSPSPSEQRPAPDGQSPTPVPEYVVVETKMLNNTRVVSVTTDQLDRAKNIAADVVARNKSNQTTRIFLYGSGQTPGGDTPSMRYEWTKAKGLTKSYDMRVPSPPKQPDPGLPEYEVLFKVKQIHNGRVYGDVLTPSLSRDTPENERERLALAVCKHERLDDIALFSTKEAQRANDSASYERNHPNALREGFLGSLKDGRFLAGEVLYP